MQRSNPPLHFRGTPAAPGMVSGPALVWKKSSLKTPRYQANTVETEQSRLDQAIVSAHTGIQALSDSLEAEGLSDEAAVFQAHVMLLEDKSLGKKVRGILEQGWNAEAAWTDAIESYAQQLEKLPDPTFALRAADLRDIGARVLRILLGREDEGKAIPLSRPSIIVARDLAPSETVALDRNKIMGFCTAEGGPTSHTAILAKALGLPAVVNLGEEILGVATGERLLVNGQSGSVIATPDEALEAQFHLEKDQISIKSEEELANAKQVAETADGRKVEVVANIGSVRDAETALKSGAEGVGLLRTEFLFLNRNSPPSEDEQYQVYRQILDVMDTRPVVVRTIDAGGDKEIAYLNIAQEANPFLGWRAIRLCLAQPELFKTQLRALLRAGVGHDLRIMFPMISTLQEVREGKRLLTEAGDEIKSRGLSMIPRVLIGIMVEIPSVAIQADLFAREVDFFSVGTNDLTQYIMAADRTNPKLAHLNDACNPAVIRQIHAASVAAHHQGIWIGVCGEMAGDLDAIPILLGLGIDELSMSPFLIPAAKSLIRRWRTDQAQSLAEHVLNLESAAAVRAYVRHVAP